MDVFAVHAVANAKRADAENVDSSSPILGHAVLVEISELKEHELINSKYLGELREEIRNDGILKRAIAVDRNTNVIVDGHHRFNALKKLGCAKIPVTFVDYQSPEIIVQAWRPSEIVTKEMVISAGLNGKKLPPKTSRHMIAVNDNLAHMSTIEKEVNIPLKDLRSKK